jgi:linoleoyl-CoA desaturase
VVLAVLLGLCAAEIGLNIQHDGGHRAYSRHPWVNRFMAMTLELIGGSSYLWRWKHGVFHHTYVNVSGHDADIDLGLLARLAPRQRRLAFHRWQHLYLWPLYGLLAIKWQCLDDFRKVLLGRINQHPVPRPRGWELLIFVAGKAVFFALAFGIPLVFHSLAVVLSYYVITGS